MYKAKKYIKRISEEKISSILSLDEFTFPILLSFSAFLSLSNFHFLFSMSTEDIETHLDDSSKKKKRPDRPIYIPKIVKREEPRTSKPSSSTYTRTKPPSVPSPLVARRISNASNAPSSDGSEHSRDTNSTVKSREYDQKVDEELPRASFYRVRNRGV